MGERVNEAPRNITVKKDEEKRPLGGVRGSVPMLRVRPIEI